MLCMPHSDRHVSMFCFRSSSPIPIRLPLLCQPEALARVYLAIAHAPRLRFRLPSNELPFLRSAAEVEGDDTQEYRFPDGAVVEDFGFRIDEAFPKRLGEDE